MKAILFEPDPREYEILKSERREDLIILNCALSDGVKTIDFYLCKAQKVSSSYLPNIDFLEKFPEAENYKVLKTINISTDTLDNQLRKNDIAEIDFIKIDTQGHELPILQGSVNSLNSVIGLEIEVEFASIYKNQPLFNEVDSFVRRYDFDLFDIKRYYWKRNDIDNYGGQQKGQLVFGDTLYFKSPERVLLMHEITQEKIVRAICIYIVYGYIDLAQILSNSAYSKGILSAEIHDAVRLIISKCRGRTPIPHFRGKWRIHNILQKMADLFSYTVWFSGTDRSLGNR
jgi:FkbM family methyltransferase